MDEARNRVRLSINLNYPAPRGGGLGRAGAILAGVLALGAMAAAALLRGASTDQAPPAAHR